MSAISGRTVHRFGGGSLDNLRLKAREAKLEPAGISVLVTLSPAEAVHQLKQAFPDAEDLHETAKVVGSTTIEKIRSVGFDIMPNPTRKLPDHHRVIHLDGEYGFNDENLSRLSAVFTDTSGY